MDLLLRLLFLLSSLFPVIPSQNPCPFSRCGNSTFQIRYPFKLQNQTLPNCDYTSLTCGATDSTNTVALELSGRFRVRDIDYDSTTIALRDPGGCLPRRLMNLSLESSVFVAMGYESFTFYDCPRGGLDRHFTPVECLSNSTNAVVAVPSGSGMEREGLFGCGVICVSAVPVSWSGSYDFVGEDDADLVLKWYVSECRDCPRQKDGWRLKMVAIFVGFILMIPALILLLTVLFVCFGCCVHNIANQSGEGGNAVENQTILARIRNLPATFSAAAPPGLDESGIKACTELIVLDFNEKHSCSICLEEYGAREKVRMVNLCRHCFHVDCIDQWLQKNNTCPICRVSL